MSKDFLIDSLLSAGVVALGALISFVLYNHFKEND